MTAASFIPVRRPSLRPTMRGCERSPAPVLRNGRTVETVKRPQADLSVGSMRRCEAAHTGHTGAFTVSARELECNAGIKAALRDLVRRSWFWLRPEENDDVDQGHTRSRIGNCCHKRPTGICWKLACAVQPKP